MSFGHASNALLRPSGCSLRFGVVQSNDAVPAGTVVRLGARPILACRFADRFGHWVGDLVAPILAGSLNTDLKSIQTGPGFECRNRNGVATGKLSAHAEGLATDIAGFELGNGSTLRVKPDADTPP